MNGRTALQRLPIVAALSVLALSEGWASDRELARAAARGEIAAFEELFRAHRARIYALCLRMTADPARAEDLTQEAFARAWRKLSSFRGDSSFPTWLHRLTVNVVLGELRSRRRREDREADLPDAVVERRMATSIDPGGRLDLERAVAALPPRARTVFVLHDVEGYRHREIAELTGIAEGTSKAHLHRARKLLRKVLAT